MTDQEFERIKIENDPTYVSKKSINAEKMKQEKERARKAIPQAVQDEDRVLYWIWGKVNPLYKKYILKDQLIRYLDSNPDITKAFGLVPNEYSRVISSMITEKHEMLNFDEFDVYFL